MLHPLHPPLEATSWLPLLRVPDGRADWHTTDLEGFFQGPCRASGNQMQAPQRLGLFKVTRIITEVRSSSVGTGDLTVVVCMLQSPAATMSLVFT